jgi:hypothetical protein
MLRLAHGNFKGGPASAQGESGRGGAGLDPVSSALFLLLRHTDAAGRAAPHVDLFLEERRQLLGR